MLSAFPGIQAIIFDMDGVLFLSSNCHEKAFRETLAEIGIIKFLYAPIAGMRTDEAFQKIFAELGREFETQELERLIARKREIAMRLLRTDGKVVPGSSELITNLKKKYRLALASSASSQTVRLFLERSGYADAFEVVLDGTTVEHAKPAPDIYLLAAEQLRLAPEHCIVIEDAVSGVQAAIRAGMRVIAIAKQGSEKSFLEPGANKVVSTIAEIS